jgi:1D-myo-inositol-tetrakisphosphate 5-kinase/inositol-polyphosphate multikinase
MQVWNPLEGEHTVYPKTYGKSLTTSTLPDGFASFFSSLTNPTHKRLIVQRLIADTEAIHAMISSHESRMYSASILFVYEGDAEALEMGIQAEAREEVIKDDEDEDDDDETIPQYISKTKLIDFAHATFRDGHGVDHNVLKGVQKVLEHLKMMDL